MDLLSFGVPVGAVMQTAFVVDDIEREMAYFSRVLGVGPFFYLPRFPAIDARYRGKSIEVDFSVALAFKGSMCFELVRQNDDTPSPFREVVEARGFGIHHVAVSTRSFDADLKLFERDGQELIATAATAMGGRAAYVAPKSSAVPQLELIEMSPPVEQFFGMMYAAAQNWDGKDPVRRL
jgi:hypothetical protein